MRAHSFDMEGDIDLNQHYIKLDSNPDSTNAGTGDVAACLADSSFKHVMSFCGWSVYLVPFNVDAPGVLFGFSVD